jgi:alpha-amylase/alpha-mannosidase (GH57 family)
MPFKIKEKFNVAYGGGIDYKRLSVEFRFYSNQKIMDDGYGWSSEYQKISLILGYNLSGKGHHK